MVRPRGWRPRARQCSTAARIVLAVDFGDVAGGCRLVTRSRDVLTRDHLTGTEPDRVLGKGGAAARVGSMVCLDRLVQKRNSQMKRLGRSDLDADSGAV